MTVNESDIKRLFLTHGIEVNTALAAVGKQAVVLVDDTFVLRLSDSPMDERLRQHRRVESLPFVAPVRHSGRFQGEGSVNCYLIEDRLPGQNLVDAWESMPLDRQEALGTALADFLDTLHRMAGDCYDIGHYIPTVPSFAGSWLEGRRRYWEILFQQIKQLSLTPESGPVLKEAHAFLDSSADALRYQVGPRLLHNDLHPQNILAYDGRLSGVIDWECSQLGEPDFDLAHLVEWCAYPPRPGLDFRPLIASLLGQSPVCAQVPDLTVRLLLYQIEHEINQMLWHNGRNENDRVTRLRAWLDGKIDDVLGEGGISQWNGLR